MGVSKEVRRQVFRNPKDKRPCVDSSPCMIEIGSVYVELSTSNRTGKGVILRVLCNLGYSRLLIRFKSAGYVRV